MKVYFCDVCGKKIEEEGCISFEAGYHIVALRPQYKRFHVHSGECFEQAQEVFAQIPKLLKDAGKEKVE